MNKEIKDHRQAIACAVPGSKFVDNLTAEKDTLCSIVFRRKSPEQRENFCARKMIALRNEIKRQLDSFVKCENKQDTFIELQEQAARDKPAEVPNQKRIDRLWNDINEAPRIIDRLPQARRGSLSFFSAKQEGNALPKSRSYLPQWPIKR